MSQTANDFAPSTQIYFKEIKGCEPLEREEEKELLKRAKKDPKAKSKLMEANLKFVFDVAKQFKGRGVPIGDLISEGNLGLSHAIDKFDTSRDVKLISYAVCWIKYYMQKSIRKENGQVAYELEDYIIEKPVEGCVNNDDEHLFKGETMYSNEYDEIEREKQENQEKVLVKIFENLNPREKTIIERYYGLNGCKRVKLKEIGADIGLTAERVRQLRNSAFEKIKKRTRNNKVLLETITSCI